MAETNTNTSDCRSNTTSYFVVKCATLESLQKCISTGVWAFRKREKPPQPQDLLEKAHGTSSNVILVFSVNNQHGWHGYCKSLFPSRRPDESSVQEPESSSRFAAERDSNSNSDSNSNNIDNEWCYFPVKWIKHFQSLSSYGCLPLAKTKDLSVIDNSPVNKARNWEEMSPQVGKCICDLIDEHFTEIVNRKQALEKEKLDAIKAKESFFEVEENCIGLFEDISSGWLRVIHKVESELGKVILACPFGSQRYNCSLPESDSDILVIYQAKTVDVLGLSPPQQTIKNSHSAKMDYTVLELHRYCELLTAGDPRYVETLFIDEESILAFASESWRRLCGFKHLLLTEDCLEKYLREAKGTKGLKQFDKWKNEVTDHKHPPAKMNKLAYIILRLLQSGKDIVKEGCIKVYRKDDSKEKQELLDARLGHFDLTTMVSLFDRYVSEIEDQRKSTSFSPVKAGKLAVQEWLVESRLQDLGMGVGVANQHADSLLL